MIKTYKTVTIYGNELGVVESTMSLLCASQHVINVSLIGLDRTTRQSLHSWRTRSHLMRFVRLDLSKVA